jgi:CDP-glucose 4,6-dehydratase
MMSSDPAAFGGTPVLVTGATGMVGSVLTRRLLDLGANVVALISDHDPQSDLFRSSTIQECSVVDGRLEDFGAVERAIVEHEVEVIFHLGAQTIVSTAHRSPRATFESNVQGTWNLLDAARLHSDLVGAVVVASSDKAYGESEVLPYQESMPLAGTYPYEVSKSMTDLVTQSYATTYGVPTAIARCGNIYGRGDLNWSRIVPGTFRSILRGEQPVLRSDGSFLRDYLHVDDVVNAYLSLVRPSKSNPGCAYNFSDESPLSVLDIYAACCRAAGVPDLEPKVLNRAEGEIRDQYLDATRARNELGWRANVTLDDGLLRTFKWYEQLLGGTK